MARCCASPALHARVAETLESQFAEVVERQPELLARHCTEAGLIEKAGLLYVEAVLLWPSATSRSASARTRALLVSTSRTLVPV